MSLICSSITVPKKFTFWHGLGWLVSQPDANSFSSWNVLWAPETLISQVGLTLLETVQAPQISLSQPLCFLCHMNLYSGVCGQAVMRYETQLSSPWTLSTAREGSELLHWNRQWHGPHIMKTYSILYYMAGKKRQFWSDLRDQLCSCFQNVLQRLFYTEQHQHSEPWCYCTNHECSAQPDFPDLPFFFFSVVSGQPVFLVYFFPVVSSRTK